MQKVFLIRHGKVENPSNINYGTLDGFPLSAEGKNQIYNLAKSLNEMDSIFCKIIASPLQRTQETAVILSQNLNTKIIIDDRLKEWDMGDWAGRPLTEFQEKSGYYDQEMNTNGMESLEDLSKRVIATIQDAIRSCDENIIICSHREPMASALIKLQKLPWISIHKVDMPMASVWQLDFIDEEFISATKIF
ncbi:histidine phosphatase family protein [Patescibacteria group bacterium]|nr:histidine phosphatase family protein [Patescibacteria group bacterium]